MPEPKRARRIALLAPMPFELRPLVRKLGLSRGELGGITVHSGKIDDVEVVATMTGIGTTLAARATERILDVAAVDHLVVVGIAGGVDSRVAIGEVVVPEIVVDGSTGTEYRPAPLGDTAPRGKISTSDELRVDAESMARLTEQGVIAMDMETAAVARVCEERHCPWSAFRSISDRVSDGMVDQAVFGLARPDGSANYRALARYLLFRPWRVRRLARLGRDMNVATGAAADAAIRAVIESRRQDVA